MRIHRIALTTVALGSMLVLAACGGGDSDADADGGTGNTQEVTVGVIPIVDVAPIYLGKQKGFFSKRDIDADPGERPGRRGDRARRGQRPVPVRLQQRHLAADRRRPRTCRSRWSPTATTPPAKPARTSAASWSRGQPDHQRRRPGRQEGRRQHPEEHRRHHGARNRSRRPAATRRRSSFVELPFPDMPAALAEGQVDAACRGRAVPAPSRSSRAAPVIARPTPTSHPDLMVAAYFTSTQLIVERPRPGRAVHRGDERVADLRRGAPRRGPRRSSARTPRSIRRCPRR